MKFDQVEAKNTNGWAPWVKAIIAKKDSNEMLDVLDSFPDKLSLQERLLLLSLNAEIKLAVEINGEWCTVKEGDYILTVGKYGYLRDDYTPFLVMSRKDYLWKYYDTKLEDIYRLTLSNKAATIATQID